ncbi:MAG: acyl-CoA dehydrogenase family protein [Gammaproteobacteria bacterium]|nr:acyl-CoA dehydrogenase family protein [Gammaproteobacteria bacterium]MCP5200322.1 acyl-CoA dehydrogenase family protein [Gammaproteobacteria bacterium]
MHFESALDAADRAFLAEVRAFCDEAIDADMAATEDVLRSQVSDHERSEAWIEKLRPRRWHVASWSEADGGAGLSAVRNYLVLYEAGLRGAPLIEPLSINYVGPVVRHFGTPEQKARYLPAIIDGRDQWCQGFSEPGSGSDLGSVRTFAERRGDVYVVNGQKIWTTNAHYANKIFALLRTRRENTKDALSFMLIDMASPGVTVRPLRLMTGDHEVNEVFFDEVEVTPDCLLGGEGQGWAVAKYLLEIERGQFVFGGRLRRRFEHLVALARRRERVPATFWAAAARLDVELLAYEVTEFRLGHLTPAAEQTLAQANVIKIGWTETMQRIDELALMLPGVEVLYTPEAATPTSGLGQPMSTWVSAYLNNRAATIYGGSNEIQRELIFRTLKRAGPATNLAHPLPYNLGEESAALVDSAARLVRERYDYVDLLPRLKSATPWTRAQWAELAELGWLAAAISEAHDGLGLPLSALVQLARALAPAAMPEPVLSQLARCGWLLDQAGDAAARAALAAWMAGESLLALVDDDGTPAAVRWRAAGDGYVLDGVQAAVLDGASADRFIVAGGGDTAALFLVDAAAPGLGREGHRAADGREFADLRFAGVEVAAGNRLDVDDVAGLLGGARELHALLLAAEMVGIAQALVPITHGYIAQREQFGTKLAEFQVLQHRLVDMHVLAVRAESALELAAFKVDELGLAAAAPYVAAAKAQCGLSGRRVAEEAVQLHGGIGMTEDLVVGHYLKRIVADTLLAGHTEQHFEAGARARGIRPSST